MSKLDVDLYGTRYRVVWARHQTLVDAMLRAGLDAPHSCRDGRCGSCVATLLSGEVDMPRTDLLDVSDLAAGLILACQVRPVSDDVHIEF